MGSHWQLDHMLGRDDMQYSDWPPGKGICSFSRVEIPPRTPSITDAPSLPKPQSFEDPIAVNQKPDKLSIQLMIDIFVVSSMQREKNGEACSDVTMSSDIISVSA